MAVSIQHVRPAQSRVGRRVVAGIVEGRGGRKQMSYILYKTWVDSRCLRATPGEGRCGAGRSIRGKNGVDSGLGTPVRDCGRAVAGGAASPASALALG
ncbi:uncharacterized protein AruCF_3801 [Achromobacter ruhlandii]|nr:uncharacterized protein AruCF_3801 [Achromobacter ruhlandii]